MTRSLCGILALACAAAGPQPPAAGVAGGGPAPPARAARPTNAASAAFAFAPPLTVSKWESMQAKRVRFHIRYGGPEDDAASHEATFARTRELIQARYPDVLVDGEWAASDEERFVIDVDGRVAYEKPRERAGVFLSMRVLEREIARARKARRPHSAYGDPDAKRGGRRGGAAAARRDPADVPKYA